MPRTVNLQETIGWSQQASTSAVQSRLHDYLNLKFAARGFPIVGDPVEFPFLEMGQPLIANFQERLRLLSDHLCPVDAAIEGFLRSCLAETGVFGPEGEWLIEGHGVDPDVVVDNLPHATFKGEDAQLKAAIDHLKKKIQEQPVQVPPTPKRPNKSHREK
jgi:hypothetical protein